MKAQEKKIKSLSAGDDEETHNFSLRRSQWNEIKASITAS
jgi:hypothetical protein